VELEEVPLTKALLHEALGKTPKAGRAGARHAR